MARARKRKSSAAKMLCPTQPEISRWKKALPSFPPHDLRDLVAEIKATEKPEALDSAFVTALRKKIDRQLNQLLRALKIDPSNPNAWRNGFLMLATIHHRVGQIAWSPRRTTTSAKRWSLEQNEAFMLDMRELMSRGDSARAAVNQLAADPNKTRQYFYRPKRSFSRSGEKQRREQALWRHWLALRPKDGNDLVTMIRSVLEPSVSPSKVEWLLDELDCRHVLENSGLVKHKTSSKRRAS